MDRDQADRLFSRKRAQPLLDLAGGKTKAARTDEIDADEIAIFGIKRVGLGDVEVAPCLLLIDRNEAPAATGVLAENSEHARLGVVDDFDDPAAVDDAVALALGQFFDADQRAVADAGRRAEPRPSRHMD